ncbi:uncharacterized protein PHALS_02012 [Plasmopara halstedii]|uniref:Uncharacterized protein n=1 Tax=Plasmopara halstedii TaxID=4781 RepID=A0A0P1AWS7_PLAHL|nr:uncharacterized protein PHALS_02012 [Plasmopara halstedii]CEG45733.1 hypothetical protein PHALS_02012 [Plasmopara halstedii]|eukprot:XP_024582102.1 hypothetical protein PHALS_02012 [Plasmopara halstedii]
MHGQKDEGNVQELKPHQCLSYDAQEASVFQLIRRKRPRTPDGYADTSVLPTPDKAPRLMVLPGLADLLATQKQRHGSIVETLSCLPTSDQKQVMAQDLAAEMELEDKSPWPSANQYFDMFSTFKSDVKIPVYDLGVDPRGVPHHPEFIYNQPVSCMYFLKCSRLLGKGSFGFPRMIKRLVKETTPTSACRNSGKKESSKDFEWRKMSFVTGLPKKLPIVRYITATCYSRATHISAKKKVFRMHAVMLADEMGTSEHGEYVLVHIRAGGSKRVGLRASLSSGETLLGMEHPVSPTSVAESYSSSILPRNKKLLHIDATASDDHDSESSVKAVTSSMIHHSHSISTATAESSFSSARLALRSLVLKSCSSQDEMVKYVMELQEELAALRDQSQHA